jgi:tRNA-dihydrouridine synthase
VKTPADALRMFETTGVDGVMIGRAALHNPFIFRDIIEYARSARPSADPAGEPVIHHDEISRRVDAMQRYLSKIDGAPQVEKWKLHKARTLVGWFSRGIPHGKDIRVGLHDITSIDDVQRILDRFRAAAAA